MSTENTSQSRVKIPTINERLGKFKLILSVEFS